MKNKIDKKSWKQGFFAGFFKAKKGKVAKKKRVKLSSNSQIDLLDSAERYRRLGRGALWHEGKIYDTNYKGKPKLMSKKFIKSLRTEYGNEMSDLDVATSYVKHMRSKFGVFDKNGNFLRMIDEKD